jgi:hypothetical protein
MVKKILSSISYKNYERFYLNKSYTVPTWTMENQGLKKNEHLIANSSKPDPNGEFVADKGLLRQKIWLTRKQLY